MRGIVLVLVAWTVVLAGSALPLAGAQTAQRGGGPRATPERPFLMGFTPFPHDLTSQALADAYDFIEAHADLITFHLDTGVPWPEALAGNDQYHPNLIADVDDMIANVPVGQKVYVSATPQNTDRGGTLADYWGADTNMPLPPPWVGRTMDDPQVITAFTNWCRYLIRRYQPDYFAYGIECNGGFTSATDPAFGQYMTLVQQVYATLKTENPALTIFLTVLTGSTNAPRNQLLTLTDQLLDHSDLVGISSYPYLVLKLGGFDTYTDPRDLPDDLLTAIRDLEPDKPVAVTETGYIAQTLDVPDYGIYVQGRRRWQRIYARRLFRELQQLEAEFVVWFVGRDYDQLLDTLDNLGIQYDQSFLIWRDIGLRRGDGASRPALKEWDRWLALPRR